MNDPSNPNGLPPPGPPPPGHQPQHPGQAPPGWQPPPDAQPPGPQQPGAQPPGAPPPGASPYGPPPGGPPHAPPGSPYGPPPGYPGPGMPYLPPRPNIPIWGGTIAALVLSIACFLCLGPLGSIPGLVLGIISLNKIKQAPDLYGGKGMAIAATVIGAVGSLIWLAYLGILVVAMIAGHTR